MTISFKLEPVSDWMPVENRLCRACDSKTEWVVVAEGMGYTYPCCNNESCQTIVRQKISDRQPSRQFWPPRKRPRWFRHIVAILYFYGKGIVYNNQHPQPMGDTDG